MPVKVLLADDEPMYRDALKKAITDVKPETANFEICGIACDGEEFVQMAYGEPGVTYVFTDMRMPVSDGLTALVRLMAKQSSMRVVICSCESQRQMAMKRTKAELPFEEGVVLVDKIAARIKAGKIEEGKINTILEGCEKLGLDPFRAAEHFGAAGYIQKPITASKIEELMSRIEQGESFVHIGITGRVEH